MTKAQHTPESSAFYGQHVTHVRRRSDAVIHHGREYVPTVYGQESGNTVWVDTIDQLFDVGGLVIFNEDQTEIHLTLPTSHKFSIRMFGDGCATPAKAEGK